MARESVSSLRNSVLGATRTASSILAGLRIQRPRSGAGGGGGHHHALADNENEDGMPLEDLDRTPPPSGANTPTLQQRFDTHHPSSDSTTGSNPFENPDNVLNTSTTSLNTPDHPTILTESSEPPPILSTAVKQKKKKKQKGAPPPQPLGLPTPRTPPPRNDEGQVYIAEPPDHTAEPSTTARGEDHLNSDETEKEVRWWTDWLCGCNEGPDRGGYNQVLFPPLVRSSRNRISCACVVWKDESQRMKALQGRGHLSHPSSLRASAMATEPRTLPYYTPTYDTVFV
jgi:hypothetical protein